MEAVSTEHYGDKMLTMLQAIWGRGFLSPGGSDEIGRLVGDANLTGALVLGIGSGAGGASMTLIAQHGAGYVTCMDVEDTVITQARALIAAAGLTNRISFVKVAPGPLPFPLCSFDVVSSVYLGRTCPDARRSRPQCGSPSGRDFVERNIKNWSLMIPVLASGEHCPTHLRATRALA